MTFAIPNNGEERLLKLIVGNSKHQKLYVHLYSNNVNLSNDFNSNDFLLGNEVSSGNFVSNGYASVEINGADWTFSNTGGLTRAEYPPIYFTLTNNLISTIYGYFITISSEPEFNYVDWTSVPLEQDSLGYPICAESFENPISVSNGGTVISVVPKIGLGAESIIPPTPTPTATPTNTLTSTPTPTQTLTNSSSSTPTPTPTNTQTSTPTNTQTLTNSSSSTSTPTPTPTPTNTLTSTPTNTLTSTPTNTLTSTPSPTQTSIILNYNLSIPEESNSVSGGGVTFSGLGGSSIFFNEVSPINNPIDFAEIRIYIDNIYLYRITTYQEVVNNNGTFRIVTQDNLEYNSTFGSGLDEGSYRRIDF